MAMRAHARAADEGSNDECPTFPIAALLKIIEFLDEACSVLPDDELHSKRVTAVPDYGMTLYCCGL